MIRLCACVIVAVGAGDAQAQHAFPEVVDGVVDGEVVLVLARGEAARQGDVAGGDYLGLTVLVIDGLHQVARNLFAQKIQVGLVAVEGLNHPVAIPVEIRHWKIELPPAISA